MADICYLIQRPNTPTPISHNGPVQGLMTRDSSDTGSSASVQGQTTEESSNAGPSTSARGQKRKTASHHTELPTRVYNTRRTDQEGTED